MMSKQYASDILLISTEAVKSSREGEEGMELGSVSQSQQAQIIEIFSVLDARELSVFCS